MHSVVILFRALRAEEKACLQSPFRTLSISLLQLYLFIIRFPLAKYTIFQAYPYKADINTTTFNELLIRCT